MSETISVHNMFSPSLSLEFSMNNLSSYCGLVDAKIRASEKDLPVPVRFASACKNSGLILLTVMDSF